MRDQSHGQTEVAVELTHPLAVTACEVVVDRDDVNALALKRVEVDRRRRDKGLALARTHLRDSSLVEAYSADHLHVEVAHAEHAARGLTHDSKRLGQNLLHRHALCKLFTELARVACEFIVGEVCHRGLERIDLLDNRRIARDLLVIVVAKEAFENRRYSKQVVSHSCMYDSRIIKGFAERQYSFHYNTKPPPLHTKCCRGRGGVLCERVS